MKKYLLNGVAFLTMGLAMTSCMKEVNVEVQEQQASLDNAQQTLGFYIPANQDWVMTSTVSTNIPINFTDGETYTVKVYSNDPLMDGEGYILAKETVANGQNFITSFRAPSYKGAYSVGITDSEGKTMYRTAYLEDNQLTEFVEDKPVEVAATRAATRANAVVQGDPFTFENTGSYYKSAIPNGAKDINTTGDYDCIQAGVLVATSDIRYNLNLWQGPAVDLYIQGNVKLPYNAYMHSANIYVLPGSTLTMEKQANYVCRIFVSENATLNYNLSTLQTNNDGSGNRSAIYNRGTVNFTYNFEANNSSMVYNEGTMNGYDFTSKPGDGNPSYIYNFGDLNLKGNLVMNSTNNFYNEGTVDVDGITYVTQQNIYWINKGHYTTGSIRFSAQNSTFYNFCQLIIEEDGCFKDGVFNMMDNSYAEVNKAVFNNFYVNMGNNSGFNIKNGSKWGQQGQGTPQGFYANNDNARVFVRMGGDNQIAAHVGAAFHVSGANLILAYNSIKFYEGAYIGNTYDESSTWNETNAETLRNNGDGRITWNTHNVTTFVTSSDFNNVKVQTVSGQCAANWTTPGGSSIIEENQTWTYAFEDNTTKCDFDMNDVVIQVKENSNNSNKLDVTLVAAGCEYDNYVYLGTTRIAWANGAEVHAALGAPSRKMVNTGRGVDLDAVTVTIDKPSGNFDFQNAVFKIRPFKIGANPDDLSQSVSNDYIGIVKEGNPSGLAQAPLGIAIPDKWKWPKERVNITNAYEGFIAWGKQTSLALKAETGGWYQEPTSGMVYE